MMWVLSRFSSISSTWEPCSASFQPFVCRPRIPIRIILAFDEQNRHSQFGTFSHPSSNRTSSNYLSHNNPANGDHLNVVQEVPQDLQYLPRISAICVVEDVSIRLDILTLEFWAILERPPIFLECRQRPHQLLVRHNQVISQKTSITSDDPCSVKTA